ncbi:hypothetical protein IFM89_017167 [Coptis chinensis]|uniref:N-acetyltransferase domain-containing protein n=1 Tax=Coptis chinensis TaxID=261450 RepID=A0A835HY25_9MAGN|nr:hypothetical protein IFM89_017167 [Coptis chinensis]
MAATISFPFSLNLQKQQQQEKLLVLNTHYFKPHHALSFTPKPSHPFQKYSRYNLNPPFSSSSESSYVTQPLTTGRFLTTEELQKLRELEKFRYFHEFEKGCLSIRVMRGEEMDMTVGLLSESFAESMLLPLNNYVNLLAFLVKQYMIERRGSMPHTATLVGYYRQGDEGEEELAGTVEVSFDKRGANATPPSPTPPKDSPYLCNMTVKKSLRRRGIGWHLLKACEELVSQMSTSTKMYLHCRMIDAAPFHMYTKAGYTIINTDNILILLTLQWRKHLMCKNLPEKSDLEVSSFEDTPVL